jgi:hypothetical protein
MTTDDARDMAQIMRAGLYRPVHVKTLRSQKLRMLLTQLDFPQSYPCGATACHLRPATLG